MINVFAQFTFDNWWEHSGDDLFGAQPQSKPDIEDAKKYPDFYLPFGSDGSTLKCSETVYDGQSIVTAIFTGNISDSCGRSVDCWFFDSIGKIGFDKLINASVVCTGEDSLSRVVEGSYRFN